MKQAKKVRFHLLLPLTVTFLLLWAGTMFLLTKSTQRELNQQMRTQTILARQDFEEQKGYYANNLEKGLGNQADWILTQNISGVCGRLYDVEGGMAIAMRTSDDTILQSQLAYGRGYEEGVDRGRRWFLELDSGLDDAGQLALTDWIIQRRSRGYEYTLWPSDAHDPGDGTTACITGEELPADAIRVERIELLHPDNTVETVVETSNHCDNPVTVELRFLRLTSLLAPAYNPQNPIQGHPKRVLENFRAAQAGLSPSLGGEDASCHKTGTYAPDNRALEEVAAVYQTLPTAVRQLRFLYCSTLLLTLLVLSVLSKILTGKITCPVEQLCEQTKHGRCQENGPIRELNDLAAAFNGAQDKLAEQLDREREFTRAAAHELKTPLAVLRTHTEALQEDILPEKRAHYLQVVLDETDRMSALVGRLLELSRLEKGTALTREWVDLKELVTEVFAPLSLPFARRNMTVDLSLADAVMVGDRGRLKEAVGNLASNALRYGSEGGKVRVTLTQDEGTFRLTMENDAPAIPENELPRLFEPFYLVDKARSRECGGTGLGLAITRAAVEVHGGICSAENIPDGVRFTLCLPTGS